MINTTLKVSVDIKKELDKLKIHPRESYDETIGMVLRFFSKSGGYEQLLLTQLQRHPEMKNKIVEMGELSRLSKEEKEFRQRIIKAFIKIYEDLQEKFKDIELAKQNNINKINLGETKKE